MPTPELASLMLFFMVLGMSITSGTSPSCIIAITPGELRGQATALFFFVINLFGSLIGPPLVGFLTDWAGDPAYLRYALSLVAFIFGLFMNLVLWFGFRSFQNSANDLAEKTRV
jgi:MFS family permease